jgi:hypothetical protein
MIQMKNNKKATLYILTCVPKRKTATAKERKIFINGDFNAVFQKIEEISKQGSYAFSVTSK